jgi:thiol-disulfide isomerase/thioredoxin
MYNTYNKTKKGNYNMKKLLLSVLLLFTFLSTAQAQSNDKKSSIELTDIYGKTYTVKGTKEGLKISGMEGKVVFLEFFGHRCPPCLRSIPHLINLQKKYKDKLAIISIEVQGLSQEQLKTFAQKKGMNYTVISGEKEHLFVSYISQRAQWQGSIPFLLALDPKGDVQFIQAGMLPESALEELFQQLSKK